MTAPALLTAPEVVIFETAATPVDRSGPVTRIEGRAVPYNVWTNRGYFMESVAPGALRKSIDEAAKGLPLLLFHDDTSFPIGISEGWDDRKDALYGVWRLDSSPEARRAGELARDGMLRWFSVGISPIRNDWQTVPPEKWNPDLGPEFMDKLTRIEARLLETSLVTAPAFPTAEVLSTFGNRMRGLLERSTVPRQPHAENHPHLREWRAWRESLRAG
jgi:HK97 family phage prohead protease